MLQVVSAREVALIYSMEAPVAALLGVYLLQEEVGLSTAVGAVMVIGACLMDAVRL